MIGTIILKEIRSNLNSYKFTIITLLSLLLILTSLFIMVKDYQQRLENYEILRPETGDATALVKPTPLSIFAKGLDENLCRSYQIRFGGQINVGSKQQSVNGIFRLFTTPDLLFVIKVILALAAMLFGFDRICGEKETGTLKLTLANSLPRPLLIFSKWIGSYLSLIVPFITAVLLASLIINLLPGIEMNGSAWLRFGLFLLSSLVYLAIFYSLGMCISALTQRSSSSLVIALFSWALLIFVLPNLGTILARQIVDIPSVQQLEIRRQQIWIKQVFDRIHGKVQSENLEANINRENDQLFENYRLKFRKLVDVSKNITRFSPASAFTFLATDLAGTGLMEEGSVKAAVLRYKDTVFDMETDSDGNIVGETPPFMYNRLGLADVFSGETMSNLLILFLFNILFFVGAYVAFIRYDVR